MELPNPYGAPIHEITPASYCIHFWQGHKIGVQGKLVPSKLGLLVAYNITIDDADSFVTAQHSATEDFRWTFTHNSGTANGHFQTFGVQNGIRRRYRIFVNDDLIGESAVWLNGWWFLYIAYSILVMMTFLAVLCVIQGLQ